MSPFQGRIARGNSFVLHRCIHQKKTDRQILIQSWKIDCGISPFGHYRSQFGIFFLKSLLGNFHRTKWYCANMLFCPKCPLSQGSLVSLSHGVPQYYSTRAPHLSILAQKNEGKEDKGAFFVDFCPDVSTIDAFPIQLVSTTLDASCVKLRRLSRNLGPPVDQAQEVPWVEQTQVCGADAGWLFARRQKQTVGTGCCERVRLSTFIHSTSSSAARISFLFGALS